MTIFLHIFCKEINIICHINKIAQSPILILFHLSTTRAENGIKEPPDFTKTPAKFAYEIQLNNGYPGDPNFSGSIYNLAKAPQGLQRPYDWNKIEISVRKDKIRVMLNGQLAAEHPGDPKRPATGPIGLQLHDRVTVAMYRNVRLRVVK